MRRILTVAVAIFLVAACGGGAPTGSPSESLPTTPRPTLTFVCPPGKGEYTPPPGGCAAEQKAALAAVSGLDYTVTRIEIIQEGWSCWPFDQPSPFNQPGMCPSILGKPVAYVYFLGTDKVAALEFVLGSGGPLTAQLVTFEVPPSNWTITP